MILEKERTNLVSINNVQYDLSKLNIGRIIVMLICIRKAYDSESTLDFKKCDNILEINDFNKFDELITYINELFADINMIAKDTTNEYSILTNRVLEELMFRDIFGIGNFHY